MASSRARRVIIKPRRFEDAVLAGNKVIICDAVVKSEVPTSDSEPELVKPISVNLSNADSEEELSVKTEVEELTEVVMKQEIKMEEETLDPVQVAESALEKEEIIINAREEDVNQKKIDLKKDPAAKQNHIYQKNLIHQKYLSEKKLAQDQEKIDASLPKIVNNGPYPTRIKYLQNEKSKEAVLVNNDNEDDDAESGIDMDLLVGDVIAHHVQWIQNKKGSRLTNDIFLTNLFPDRDSMAMDQSELLNKIEEARTIQLKFYKNPKALEYFEQEPFAHFLDPSHTFYRDIKSMERGLRLSGTSLQNRIKFPNKKIKMRKSPDTVLASSQSQPQPNHESAADKPNILGKRKKPTTLSYYEVDQKCASQLHTPLKEHPKSSPTQGMGTEEHYKALLQIKDNEIARLKEVEKSLTYKYTNLNQVYQNLRKEEMKKTKFNQNLWKLNSTLEKKLELQDSQIATLTECLKTVGDFTKSSDSNEDFEIPDDPNDMVENIPEKEFVVVPSTLHVPGPSKRTITIKPKILSRFVADTSTINGQQNEQNEAENENKDVIVGEEEDVQIITSTNTSNNPNPEKGPVTVFLDQRNNEVAL